MVELRTLIRVDNRTLNNDTNAKEEEQKLVSMMFA